MTRRTRRHPMSTQVIEPLGEASGSPAASGYFESFSALSPGHQSGVPRTHHSGKKETKTPVGRVAPDALPCNSGAYLRQVGDEGARLGSGQYRTASIVEVALE
jgi:hypothetical protein